MIGSVIVCVDPSMNIEHAVSVLRKARMDTKDPIMGDVFKLLTELVHEVSIARSENALLTLRVETLEDRKPE